MTEPYQIELYQTDQGREPYTDWEESLDKATLARIDTRFTRIRETGNLGNFEPVGDGVFELKFDFGPGYRVYFGFKTERSLLILLGGSKKRQQKDINKAQGFWREHLSQKRGKK